MLSCLSCLSCLKPVITFIALCSFMWVPDSCLAELKPHSPARNSHVQITVFVHGTLFTDVLLRKHPLWRQDQILLDKGLVEIPMSKIHACAHGNVPQEERQDAACYLVTAYDALANMVTPKDYHKVYAAFGWVGEFSQEGRKSAGTQLYTELCDLRDHYQTLFSHVHIIVAGYSHGSNVAFWLPEAERTYKRQLTVECLLLFGTPYQQETIQFITSPLFKTIISCYSDGDAVPTWDIYSTVTRQSYKKMSEVVALADFKKTNPSLVRCDVRLLFNFNESVANHANMWMLGRLTDELKGLRPFPLLVLAPLLIAQVARNPGYPQLDFCIHSSHRTLLAHITTDTPGSLNSFEASPNVYSTLLPLRRITKKLWHPDDTYTGMFFNYKNYVFLKHYLFGA